MKVFVDCDVVKYRAGFAAEKMHYTASVYDPEWDEIVQATFTTAKELDAWLGVRKLTRDSEGVMISQERVPEPVGNALYNVRSIITNILSELDCTEENLVACISGPDNFRNEVATVKKYKGNRDKVAKPVHGPAIVEYMKQRYSAVESVGEEADDYMGRKQWEMYKSGDVYGSVIATIDKDLDMIPGLHFNFVKDEQYFIDEEQALRLFYQQLISGDTVDNIPGVPGQGKGKASKALADCEAEMDMYETARTLYVQGYGKEVADDVLREMGQLLWIRREENEMWLPPTERGDNENTG